MPAGLVADDVISVRMGRLPSRGERGSAQGHTAHWAQGRARALCHWAIPGITHPSPLSFLRKQLWGASGAGWGLHKQLRLHSQARPDAPETGHSEPEALAFQRSGFCANRESCVSPRLPGRVWPLPLGQQQRQCLAWPALFHRADPPCGLSLRAGGCLLQQRFSRAWW